MSPACESRDDGSDIGAQRPDDQGPEEGLHALSSVAAEAGLTDCAEPVDLERDGIYTRYQALSGSPEEIEQLRFLLEAPLPVNVDARAVPSWAFLARLSADRSTEVAVGPVEDFRDSAEPAISGARGELEDLFVTCASDYIVRTSIVTSAIDGGISS